MRDLGLTYDQAMHGVQSAVRFVMTKNGIADDDEDAILRMVKHLRVGVDARASDMLAIVELLLAKGVFSRDEYLEHVRLAANEELAMHEEHIRAEYNFPQAHFR